MPFLSLKDASGNGYNLAAETANGLTTPHSVPEVGGSAVSASNPLPVNCYQQGGWSVTVTATVAVTQSGTWAVASTPQVAGAAVSTSNPMPVSQQVAGAVLSAGNPMPVAVQTALPAGSNLVGAVAPASGAGVSRSLTTTAATSTTLFPSNTSRKFFWFQAPQGAGIWINRLGGTAGPNLSDCTYWPAGSYYESGPVVTTSAITVYCATGSLVIPAGEV